MYANRAKAASQITFPLVSAEIGRALRGASLVPMATQNLTPSADVLSPLLSINEVARLLRISRPTVYALIRRGELVPIRVGERSRFEPADIRAYLERHREEPAP